MFCLHSVSELKPGQSQKRVTKEQSIARHLELLDMLLQKGFLDEKEYETRKDQLLKVCPPRITLTAPKPSTNKRMPPPPLGGGSASIFFGVSEAHN